MLVLSVNQLKVIFQAICQFGIAPLSRVFSIAFSFTATCAFSSVDLPPYRLKLFSRHFKSSPSSFSCFLSLSMISFI